jgi:lipoprotein-anchoring transpeptidase ErfK/SrfK
MIGTSARAGARAGVEASSGVVRTLVILLTVVVGMVAMAGVALAGIAGTLAASPPSVSVDLPSGTSDLPLNSEMRVALGGWNTQLEQVALYETPIGPDGRPGIERALAVQATMLRQSWWPEGSEYLLRAVAADPAVPALNADASYRLVVRASALTAGLPLPAAAPVEREVKFGTVRSPVPRLQTGPAKLKWGQPLQITWDAPIASVAYAISPETPFRAAIDATNPQLSTLVLEDPEDGQTYKVTVTEARGTNGIALSRPAEYTVIAPPRPQLLEAGEPRTVEVGKPLTLKWSVPMDRVKLDIEPSAVAQWAVDPRDPTLVTVTLDQLKQGETYTVKATEAFSKDGAPLWEAPSLTFETPERLMVETWDPEPEGKRVSVQTKPGITFAQPVRDRKAATAALSIEPAIPGRWAWKDDQTVQFMPTGALPYDTDITVTIKPGPDGARSASGSYFENPAILELKTESDKLIDVDVTRQLMTLYEKGKVVKTYPIGTGVPGADTPLGEFNVEYKMPTARFRGTRVDGFQYDIPDVKWVLAFMGDYTIHGVYWRGGFGTPSSNGCVGLTDENAKELFDWSPEGTRIKIHM